MRRETNGAETMRVSPLGSNAPSLYLNRILGEGKWLS